ncbi:MAG: M15 family metallopeptidase [Eubacteriales bacterium]|nr:M15 family metallopeptidase [Eubacteriales bacterium]
MRKKTLWIITMAFLCLVLYTIVISRMNRQTNVIFGGVDGAYVSSDSVTFTDPNATEETPVPTENIWPDIDITLDIYSIVNNDNLLSSAYEPEVTKIGITRYMLFRTDHVAELDAMLDAMIEAGFTPYVAGAYRTYSYQSQMFNTKASQIAYEMAGGKTVDYDDPSGIYQEAVEEAKKITMMPGASEHQLGLAVDLLDRERSRYVYEDMDQDFFAWLDEHCWEYGFIKRYPTRKLLLTGWDEPWHYRYVGKEAAKFIMEQGICLEEFYAHYVPDFTY